MPVCRHKSADEQLHDALDRQGAAIVVRCSSLASSCVRQHLVLYGQTMDDDLILIRLHMRVLQSLQLKQLARVLSTVAITVPAQVLTGEASVVKSAAMGGGIPAMLRLDRHCHWVGKGVDCGEW